jgi:hypothetical protein
LKRNKNKKQTREDVVICWGGKKNKQRKQHELKTQENTENEK